jgi:hypothetical protein
MASPKNGSAPSAVTPTEPKAPLEADKADPGEVEKAKAQDRGTGKGKYGSLKSPPAPKRTEEVGKEDSWIEIELVDESGKPVASEEYLITTADGKPRSGTLDEKGLARVENIWRGQCKVTFLNLDKDAWENA